MFYLLTQTMNFLRVISIILKSLLSDDLTGIQVLGHVMYSDTIDLDTVFHSLLYRICSSERRQQRRVNIDYPAFIGRKKHIGDYTHISRQADEFYAQSLATLNNLRFVFCF